MTLQFIIRCNFCNKSIHNLRKIVKDNGDFHSQCYLIKDYVSDNLKTQRSIVDFKKCVGEISFPLKLLGQEILSRIS